MATPDSSNSVIGGSMSLGACSWDNAASLFGRIHTSLGIHVMFAVIGWHSPEQWMAGTALSSELNQLIMELRLAIGSSDLQGGVFA